MVRKGFRRRLILYVVSVTAINLSWVVLAILFDSREIIPYFWIGLPFAFLYLGVFELTIDLKGPRRMKNLSMMVFWGLFAAVIAIWVASGFWWMSIPIVCMFPFVYRSRLRSKSRRRGSQTTPHNPEQEASAG